jgi:hypothetical protein
VDQHGHLPLAQPECPRAPLVEHALENVDGAPARDLEELAEADAEARRLAEQALALA